MEIKSKIHFGLLRNPFFIVGFLIVANLPETVSYCSGLFSESSLSSCSREVLNRSLIQNSILSSSIVFIAFESERICFKFFKLVNIPKDVYDWIKAHIGIILISGITFSSFIFLNQFVNWFAGHLPEFMDLVKMSTAIKAILIVSFSYYSLIIHAEMRRRKEPLNLTLEAGDKIKEKVMLGNIRYFFKENRKVYLCTIEGSKLPVNFTLKDLEFILPGKNFARINRSVIVNLCEIKEFNYWENEKYILKTISGKQFVITRKRLKEVKKNFLKN